MYIRIYVCDFFCAYVCMQSWSCCMCDYPRGYGGFMCMHDYICMYIRIYVYMYAISFVHMYACNLGAAACATTRVDIVDFMYVMCIEYFLWSFQSKGEEELFWA